jgi:hypothetical protein
MAEPRIIAGMLAGMAARISHSFLGAAVSPQFDHLSEQAQAE